MVLVCHLKVNENLYVLLQYNKDKIFNLTFQETSTIYYT